MWESGAEAPAVRGSQRSAAMVSGMKLVYAADPMGSGFQRRPSCRLRHVLRRGKVASHALLSPSIG